MLSFLLMLNLVLVLPKGCVLHEHGSWALVARPMCKDAISVVVQVLGAQVWSPRVVQDTGSPTVSSSRSWKSMEMEIQSSLEKLVDINDAMSRCAASATPTTSVTQKLARHRDILHELTQEFRRIKGNISSMREHAELLSSVRDDISEYKASGTMSPKMQLLRERSAIHGSISHIDEVINQAQATRSVLGSQRALFGDVGGKVKVLSEKFPVIRGLLGSIKRKRSRDTIILSTVIAACTLFLIIYWLSK
ncbi:Golgi SNAP receptor complex member 1-2 isoform X4 [Amaranthus tricolor]|uniref:Golgi SNAP receptor complex member 1-2 isoform X4 n=1 Tax=Amaranthus tricolor TaxID=29722 RepID=UPI0025835FB3|nr:Golgi SNAP receptor complex member 1-2 isoform X4 [Amaranthus tricolor]